MLNLTSLNFLHFIGCMEPLREACGARWSTYYGVDHTVEPRACSKTAKKAESGRMT